MRLYSRTQDDQINACARSLFDARHGRVALAFDRLSDVEEEGPVNDEVAAEIAYSEGVVRRDFLGQGSQAYLCFKLAAHLRTSADYYDPVINATLLAPTGDEFTAWVGQFKSSVPQFETTSHQFVEGRLTSMENGADYFAVLHTEAGRLSDLSHKGDAAAQLEVALSGLTCSPDEEASARRCRAEWLRSLDIQQCEIREVHSEYFPPDERLALIEATKESERALTCDEYDATLWNLKAVYCYYLEQWQESLVAAERSIELRPAGYAKPHINRALALWALRKDREALTAAQEAQQIAVESSDGDDEEMAADLVRQYHESRPSCTLKSLTPLLRRMVKESSMTADAEIQASGGDPNVVIGGFFNRCLKRVNAPATEFVPVVAELVSDFCPERVHQVLQSFRRSDSVWPIHLFGVSRVRQACYERCVNAMLFVTARTEGVTRRDAARVLCLTILGCGDPHFIRSAYRKLILATSAALEDELSQLDEIMRRELARIHPELPKLVADQDPISEAEAKCANREMQQCLDAPRGCSVVSMLIGVGLTAFLYWIVRL